MSTTDLPAVTISGPHAYARGPAGFVVGPARHPDAVQALAAGRPVVTPPSGPAAMNLPGDVITALAADGLQTLAGRVLHGDYPAPLPGAGLPRVHGATVVPLLVHDALCGYRGAVPDDDGHLEVLRCRGCGLAFLKDDAEGTDNWWNRTRALVAAVNAGDDERGPDAPVGTPASAR